MILTSTKEPIRFTPPWLEGTDNAPVFLLRAGSVIERGQMEAELSGEHYAASVFGFELREAFKAGLLHLLADDPELDRFIELGGIDADGDPEKVLSDDDRRTLSGLREVLGNHFPEYRALLLRIERRREIAPLVAFRRFCVGWENLAQSFKRGRDGAVDDTVMISIDPLQLKVAGAQAFALQYGGQEKN